MRSTKFRAWHRENKCWLRLWTIKLSIDSSVMAVTDMELEMYGTHEVDLVQYTGLKDKNGKEIYEGDIVRGNTVHGFVVVPMLGGLSVLSVLNFGQEHNELIASPTNDAQTASWLRESEVIGNIYEHPELLDKETT